MSKKLLLRRLQHIRKPIIASYGCHDTGIEFKVLTSAGGCCCHGGGGWPIFGPVRFNVTQLKAGRILRKAGFDPREESLTENFFTESDVSLTRRELTAIQNLGEEALLALLDMTAQACKHGVTYFFYRDDCGQDITYFRSYREAEEYVIAMAFGAMQPWKRMTEEDLSDWVEELENAEADPFCGRDHVKPIE